ncbi:MAG: APC family permease [Kofleriaceae bacterium]
MSGRQLGARAAAAIVVANMIGTGVFTSAGYQAASLHDPMTMLLTWVVGGVIALCGAASYAELGAMLPRVGGEYVYLREAYHPAVGAMSGWASLSAGFSAPIAAAAILFAAYVGAVIPGLGSSTAQHVVAIGLIVAMTAMHGFDTVVGGAVQAVMTAAKAVLIAGFVLAGLLLGDGDWGHLASRAGGLDNVGTSAFAVSLMYVSFAYSGWNAAAYMAGEIEAPQRNLPRALLLGTGSVMVLYILLNLVFLYALPPEVLAGAPGQPPIHEVGDAAARALFGPTAGTLVSTLIALALVSAVSAMVMTGPRVYTAMADDGALPAWLGRRTARGVPLRAVVLQGLLAIVIVLATDLGGVIRYVGFTLAVFAALTVAAVFVLRARQPAATRPYRTIGYPVTPLLFVVTSAWIAQAQIRENPRESLWVGATLLGGAALYAAFQRRRPAGAPPS